MDYYENYRNYIEKHEKAQREKRAAENVKKYHTDDIRKYNNQIIAIGRSNWDYRLVIFDDNSAALFYIAKPGSGCKSGIFCGTNILKYHLQDLKRYEKAAHDSIIPADWIITEPGFFQALNIA